MKNKGFTLIELLGVIIILALLMIIVFPSIVNSVKNSSNKTDDLTKELIYNAADLFVDEHINDFPKKNGNKYIIELKELIDEGLLTGPIKLSDSDSDITNNKCIQVTYNNEYIYELKQSGKCKSSLPPKEYQIVEYIESTGEQYIDTGFTPTGKLTVVGKVYILPPDREMAIIGTDEKGWELGVSNTGNRLFSYINGTTSFGVVPTNSIFNTELEFTAINDLDNLLRSVSVNIDNAYNSTTTINTAYMKKLYLFNYRNTYFFTGKCYKMKIYDNDILVRDFIPCYRKSDNVVGMYDVVNNVFYTNSGTGTFGKGNDI